MSILKILFFTLLITWFGSASAGELTKRFTIEKMNCALCPVTVRKSMENVPGVKQVEVDYDSKIATVVFDPAIANENLISDASTSIGYPAQVLVESNE